MEVPTVRLLFKVNLDLLEIQYDQVGYLYPLFVCKSRRRKKKVFV